MGDLRGAAGRLDHLVYLGVDALWLSPLHPSPGHDLGYDVSDYVAIDPLFGTLADFDGLVDEAHRRGLAVLMDLVACHTSIEHPWFRERPDFYVWTDRPNNWRSAFGGPAWSPDPLRRSNLIGRPGAAGGAGGVSPNLLGRPGAAGGAGGVSPPHYLHSFYPEQADLDWRNPEVVEAMQEVIRFWLARGVDGFRLDAIDRLLKDPELRDDPPSVEAFGLPVPDDSQGLSLSHSRDAPDIGQALAAIREAAGDALLVGEVYLPGTRLARYVEHLDHVFSFELLHARWDAAELGSAIAAMPRSGAAWVLSNHDFGRLASRFGERNARAAALLLLTLPGASFLYQGDEIGLTDGPGADPPVDRAGRDAHRHPMQWDGSPSGGFTGGRPWLAPVDPARRNVADQRGDPASMLELVRRLIALRPTLGSDLELLHAAPDLLALRRGEHLVAVNTAGEPLPLPREAGQPLLESEPGACRDGRLGGHAGAVLFHAPPAGK